MITLFASSFVDHVVLINHLPELTQIRVRRFKEISFISFVNTKLFVCDVSLGGFDGDVVPSSQVAVMARREKNPKFASFQRF